MIDKEIVRKLMKSQLFKAFSETQVNETLMMLHAKVKHCQKGEYIFHAHDQTTAFGIMLEGNAHIIKEDYWGNRTILTMINTGSLFAEAFACAKIPMAVSVAAASDCEYILLDLNELENFTNSFCYQKLMQNLMFILAMKNSILATRIEHLAQRKLKDKLLSFLSEQAASQGSSSFDIPYNRQELADVLCVDRSALSAELSLSLIHI